MELATHLIGEIPMGEYFAFILFTLFGMAYVKIASYNKRKKANLRSNPFIVMKFKLNVWLQDNVLDFILALMTSFFVYRFFPDALSFVNRFYELPEYSDRMLYGLLLGLTFQKIFHKWLNNIQVKRKTVE